MDENNIEQRIDRSYDKFVNLLNRLKEENKLTEKKFERDIELLEKRFENTKDYYMVFLNYVLSKYPDFKFQLSIEYEAKRFAVLYAKYLEILRLYVVDSNGNDTKMSIYKIISACQATIVELSPIVEIEPNGNEEKRNELYRLNGRLAHNYALNLLTDWISADNTQNQDMSYNAVEFLSDKYVKELTDEHLKYLIRKVRDNLKYGGQNCRFDLFLMSQYWKIFHYYLFDPRTMEKDSI